MRALAYSCDLLEIWVTFWVTVNTWYLIQYLWYLIWYLQDLILDLIFPSVKTIRNKKRTTGLMTDSPNFIDYGSPPGYNPAQGQGQKAGIYIPLPSKYLRFVFYFFDLLGQCLQRFLLPLKRLACLR